MSGRCLESVWRCLEDIVRVSSGHTCKKFLALLAARGEYSFSSDTFGIIFSQSESKM